MESRKAEALSARRARLAGWLIFAFFLSLYLLTARGRITVIDGLTRPQVTAQIVERGRLSLPSDWPHAWPGKKQGNLYSYYGLGQSLVGLPLYLIGRAGARLLPQSDPRIITELAYSFLNCFMAAALCAVFFSFCLQLGYSRQTAFSITLLLGLGTILWQHSKDSFEQPQEALLGLTGVMFAHRGLRLNRRGPLWWSGFFFGAGLLTRESAFFFFAPALIYLLAEGSRRRKASSAEAAVGEAGGLGAGLAAAGACLGGAVVFLLVMGGYNALRSGSPFLGGYGMTGHFRQFSTPLLRGLAGLLISPGRGLLEYDPVLLLALIFPVSFSLFWQRTKALGALFLVIGMIYLLFYSRFRHWDGGLCWGPRYLLPIIPLALLPFAEVIERPSLLRGRTTLPGSTLPVRKVIVWLVVGISVVIQLSSVLVDHKIWFHEVAMRNQQGARIALNSNPINSPLLRQWQSLGRVLGLTRWEVPVAYLPQREEFCTGIDLWWLCWPAKNAERFRLAAAIILALSAMLFACFAAANQASPQTPANDKEAGTLSGDEDEPRP